MKTKICTKCGERKKLSEFNKDKYSKDGLCYNCKKCQKIYRLLNRQKIKNRDKINHKKYPWKRIFKNIQSRCNNVNDIGYKNYGGRGIKCLTTKEEIRKLCIRDNYWSLKQASIDRIDNDGDYTYDNCRIIEKRDNTIKENVSRRKSILQYDLKGNFIKEWKDVYEIINKYSITSRSIYSCCAGETKTSCGFIWKYKNEL